MRERARRDRAGRGVAVAALAAASTACFAYLTVSVADGRTPRWDTTILRAFGRYYDHTRVVEASRLFLALGMGGGGVFALALFALLVRRRQWGAAAFWAAAVAGSVALSDGVKELVRRPPIGDQSGWSFPSGNATASMAAVVALISLLPARWRPAAAACAAPLVASYGAALVFLAWHYPSDVIAGWCAGIAWVTALLAVARSRGGLRQRYTGSAGSMP
jgi:membrane-associated phospholipid phosphatase